jgi:mannose/fructose/N-acetylgalactosamine-specific phosphotransferase system component IID
MQRKRLTKFEFVSMFLRSFFIQAVWNYESMLSVGLTFSLMPVARKLFKMKNDISKFLLRHLGFFNAHPYFASFAIGAIARAETENNADIQKIERLKNALIGPLGALGDQLFWATIKPTSYMIAICGIMLIPGLYGKVASVILSLIIFNVSHLYFRWHGLVSGYIHGYRVYKDLKISKYKKLYHLFLFAGAFSLGLIIGLAGANYTKVQIGEPVLFAFALGSAYFLSGFRKSFYFVCLATLVSTTILGIVIESI